MIKNRTAIVALLTGLNFINYLDRFILAAVLPRVQEPVEKGGLGLSSLRDRLARLYGPAHLPEITSAPGQGTCVRLRLPDTSEGLAA